MLKANTRIFQVFVAGSALAMSLGSAPIAIASVHSAGETYNDAKIDLNGGNAAALSGCVNYAQLTIKFKQKPQHNFCESFAEAKGGDVVLLDTALTIIQAGGPGKSYNKADVNLNGGDATALASCVNVLQGSTKQSDKQACSSTAVARGGDVVLDHTDITIIQGS